LEEQCRCVAEELAEAELARGRHRERLAFLYNLVSEEPLRERGWSLLMLSLYRCGQQAEALRAYQRASTALGELGLAPGAELHSLERAISVGDLTMGPEALGRLRPADLPEPNAVRDSVSGLEGRRRTRPGTFATNLPSQLTSFIGRDAELAGVADALRASRLVTVTGAGGVGKTRLAIHVAADVLRDYPDGAWFCELAPAASADELAHVVAAAIGARIRPNLSAERSVIDRVGDTKLLILLDNCEHLLDRAGQFAEALLVSCPELRILATSRERLGIAGEQVWPLGPLSVPDASGLGTLGQSEAVALFADRAASVKPSFTISPANAAAVDEICRRLDGIPLAIELAAARVAAMTPTEIASNLDRRFRLLKGGATSDPRHRTLGATLDWSYSFLEGSQQTVFNRLGVFSGRFDARAAEAIAAHGGVEAWDVLDALGELVGKSMVTVEDSSHDSTRYLLLETFRHYALDRLQDTDDVVDMRRRHAEHYAAVAEDTGRGLRGPDELAWRARFRVDRDNLRAAVAWALGSEVDADRTYGLRIIAALANESMQEGEPIGVWAEAALLQAEAAPPSVRAAVFASAAWFVHRRGDLVTARELCLEALRDGLPEGCPSPEMAYFVLAFTAMPDSDRQAEIFDDAHRALDAARADDFAHGFLWSAALFLQLVSGDALSEVSGREALRVARRVGNPSLLVRVLCNLAALSWLDDPDTARHELEEAVALVEAGASAHMLGFGSPVLARLRMQRGDLEGAREAVRAAIVRSHEDSDPFILATALDRGIHVLEGLGLPEDAAVWAGATADGPLGRATFLPARERPLRLEAIDRLRLALGEDPYGVAAARGALMSDDDLVRHALAVL
jgi:predicted ATPase